MSKQYRRQDLIKLCMDGFVDHEKWGDRDSSDAQRQLGEALALLKADCPVKTLYDEDLCTNDKTIWIEVGFTDFSGFENGVDNNAKEIFYIPTRTRLSKANGKDWY